jgi:hypothetical protein
LEPYTLDELKERPLWTPPYLPRKRSPDAFLIDDPHLYQQVASRPTYVLGLRDFWFGAPRPVPFIPAVTWTHSVFRRSLFGEGCFPAYTDYLP